MTALTIIAAILVVLAVLLGWQAVRIDRRASNPDDWTAAILFLVALACGLIAILLLLGMGLWLWIFG